MSAESVYRSTEEAVAKLAEAFGIGKSTVLAGIGQALVENVTEVATAEDGPYRRVRVFTRCIAASQQSLDEGWALRVPPCGDLSPARLPGALNGVILHRAHPDEYDTHPF